MQNAKTLVMIHATEADTPMDCGWLPNYGQETIVLHIDGHAVFLGRESLNALCKAVTAFNSELAGCDELEVAAI